MLLPFYALLTLSLIAGFSRAEVSLEEIESYGINSFKHHREVSDVVCHPDGIHVLSSSIDESVRLWELKSGKLIRRYTHPKSDSMWGIQLLPEGKEFLVGANSGLICRFEVATGNLLKVYRNPDKVYRLALHPDGKHFVATGFGKCFLWNLETGEIVTTFAGHEKRVYTALILNEGKQLLTGSKDKTMRLWDIKSGDCLRVIGPKTDYGRIFTLAASPNGKRFAMASGDNFIRVFDSASLEVVWQTELGGRSGCVVTWSPDGRSLAAGVMRKSLCLLDAENGTISRRIEAKEGVEGNHIPVTFSRDGKVLVSSVDDILRLHDCKTGRRIEPTRGFAPKHDNFFQFFAMSAGAEKIYMADRFTLTVRDRKDPRNPRTYHYQKSILKMTLSDDGRFLAMAFVKDIIVFETEEMTEACRIQNGVASFSFSADGSRLCITNETSGSLWAIPSGKKVRDFKGHAGRIHFCSFLDRDGLVMTAATDGTFRFWPLPDGGEEVTHFKRALEDRLSSALNHDFAVFDNGRTIVAGGRNVIVGRILPKQEKEVGRVPEPEEIQKLLQQLTDDDFEKREEASEILAGYDEDVLANLRSIKTEDPELQWRLKGAQKAARLARFPDESLEVLKVLDATVWGFHADPLERFWVACKGSSWSKGEIVMGILDREHQGVKVVETLKPMQGCLGVRFSPDGSHLASLNADGTATLYRVNAGEVAPGKN